MHILTDEHIITNEILCRKPPWGMFFHLLSLTAVLFPCAARRPFLLCCLLLHNHLPCLPLFCILFKQSGYFLFGAEKKVSHRFQSSMAGLSSFNCFAGQHTVRFDFFSVLCSLTGKQKCALHTPRATALAAQLLFRARAGFFSASCASCRRLFISQDAISCEIKNTPRKRGVKNPISDIYRTHFSLYCKLEVV